MLQGGVVFDNVCTLLDLHFAKIADKDTLSISCSVYYAEWNIFGLLCLKHTALIVKALDLQ